MIWYARMPPLNIHAVGCIGTGSSISSSRKLQTQNQGCCQIQAIQVAQAILRTALLYECLRLLDKSGGYFALFDFSQMLAFAEKQSLSIAAGHA